MEKVKNIVLFIGFSIWITLTIMALKTYPGSGMLYILFSAVSAAMWVAAWVGPKSYFYIFISTFWMLGFWMKTCIHVIFDLGFGEPVGTFNGSMAEWDHAVMVSSVAMLAALIFRLGQICILKYRCDHDDIQPNPTNVPLWYLRHGLLIWCCTIVIILCVAIANFRWSVFQIGLMPNILPFKLNALVALGINLFFPFWVATLIWWDVCLHRSILIRFIGAIFEAVISSVSILSRGAYVYHTLHYLVSSYFNRNIIHLSRQGYLVLLGLILSGVIATTLLTTNMRNYFYTPVTQQQTVKKQSGQRMVQKHAIQLNTVQQNSVQDNLAQYKVAKIPPVQRYNLYQTMFMAGVPDSVTILLTLTIERWIGIEGVLAVSSYNRVGGNLFINGWFEKSTLSTKSVFNYIARSIYVDPRKTGAENFLFSSTPGLVAMLYYSGSYIIVFVGVLLFLLFGGVAEYFVFTVMKNPFVVSFFAIFMSNMTAQFGGLHQFVILCVEIGAVLGFISLVQIYGTRNHVSSQNNIKRKVLSQTDADEHR